MGSYVKIIILMSYKNAPRLNYNGLGELETQVGIGSHLGDGNKSNQIILIQLISQILKDVMRVLIEGPIVSVNKF
jgi:hypothetical protein